MSYSVRKSGDLFNVIEKDTKQIIVSYEDQKEARQICRSLNLGAGFNGYTPPFFLAKFGYKQKERPSKN